MCVGDPFKDEELRWKSVACPPPPQRTKFCSLRAVFTFWHPLESYDLEYEIRYWNIESRALSFSKFDLHSCVDSIGKYALLLLITLRCELRPESLATCERILWSFLNWQKSCTMPMTIILKFSSVRTCRGTVWAGLKANLLSDVHSL